ncbi:ABC transporter permease [Candidatus Hecatella orcuttiae]|uniref:ABC transporter permease n=1 Tax=Candidatus Hecatella orcuttiae TaxID=1935119 RepID=UPI002867B037|nr:ABC transporter permease [Candidatus Hecatella orcuttiae]
MWLREVKRFARAKSRVASAIAMPLMWLVFFGVGFSSSFVFPGLKGGYLAFLAPGVVAIALLFSSVFSGVSVLWDKQFGFLKEILVAPVSRTSIVLGKTLGGASTSMVQGLAMLGLAILVVGRFPGVLPTLAMVGVCMLISLAFVSLGVSFASTMEDPHGFQLIMNFIVMPMFFLSGAFFPLTGVPTWMRILSYVNPMTYGVDALRGFFSGENALPLLLDLSVLVGVCVGFLFLGAYLFKRKP